MFPDCGVERQAPRMQPAKSRQTLATLAVYTMILKGAFEPWIQLLGDLKDLPSGV